MLPPVPVPVKCTEHVETPAVPATRRHVDESKVPGSLPCASVQVTVPAGLVAPVVSVTVTVHSEGWPMTTVVSQVTVVAVV